MPSYFFFFIFFIFWGEGVGKDNYASIFHKQQLSFFDCNIILKQDEVKVKIKIEACGIINYILQIQLISSNVIFYLSPDLLFKKQVNFIYRGTAIITQTPYWICYTRKGWAHEIIYNNLDYSCFQNYRTLNADMSWGIELWVSR